MIRSHISVRGIYTLYPQLFDDLIPPTGVTIDDLREEILTECAELGVIYPDGPVFRHAIGRWCRANTINWQRISEALTLKYNPLHNYDRYEEWDDSDVATGSACNKQSLKNSATAWNPSEGMTDTTATDSDSHVTSNNQTQQLHSGHLYGNIGVTTSAQMLDGEMDVRVKYTILDTIVNEFKQKFCVCVY